MSGRPCFQLRRIPQELLVVGLLEQIEDRSPGKRSLQPSRFAGSTRAEQEKALRLWGPERTGNHPPDFN